MRRLLYIVHDFPPVGGGRVLRAVRFVRNLPRWGWEPIVLTPRQPAGQERDELLQAQVERHCSIFRTPSLEWRWARRIWSSAAKSAAGSGASAGWQRALRRMRWWMCVPDSRIGWVPFCVAVGRRLIRAHGIEAILATGSPYSSFLSAAILKRWSGLPLILDFRDDWVTYNEHYFADKGRAVLAIEARMERWVIRQADQVITVTERLVDNFRRRHPAHAAKFRCISNGFDPGLLVANSAERRNSRCRITYAGALYPHRSPRFFLNALAELLHSRSDLRRSVEFVVAGEVDPAIAPLLARFPYPDVVRSIGFVPHAESLALMRQSDVLLVLEDQTTVADTILPGKIFEYLQSGRPVLTLANEGTMRDVLTRLNAGPIVASQDEPAIRAALEVLVERRRAGELRTELDQSALQAFSAVELSRQLAAEILDPLCTRAGANR